MSKDYTIKKSGSPVTYGDGAIRNTKEGKGRFDLIPAEPLDLIDARLNDLSDHYDIFQFVHNRTGVQFVLGAALNNCFDLAFVNLLFYHYFVGLGNDKETYTTMHDYYTISDAFWNDMFVPVFRDLAIHFQKGAEIYGEHNCEKGIPLESFKDSAIRHTCQYMMHEKDENHFIAAVWNYWMAIWTDIHMFNDVHEDPQTPTEDISDEMGDPEELVNSIKEKAANGSPFAQLLMQMVGLYPPTEEENSEEHHCDCGECDHH